MKAPNWLTSRVTRSSLPRYCEDRVITPVRRAILILLLLFVTLGVMMLLPPITQDLMYHAFTDRRALLGIPSFLNVVTNLPFLAVGLAGIILCTRKPGIIGACRAWQSFFIGVTLIGLGSSYYHLAPDNNTLVWDRLPMSIGFMGLLVAVISEHVNVRLEKILLTPVIFVGVASVIYWHYTDDLRLYVWVQFIPLLAIPALLFIYKSPFPHRGMLIAALGIYAASKVAEYYDQFVFDWTSSLISGHSLKHLLAALAPFLVYLMLKRRTVKQS